MRAGTPSGTPSEYLSGCSSTPVRGHPFPLRLDDAHGLPVDEEQVIRRASLERIFAHGDAPAGVQIHRPGALDHPAGGCQLAINGFAGAILRSDSQVAHSQNCSRRGLGRNSGEEVGRRTPAPQADTNDCRLLRYSEWPERESNPRHADFQGVGDRSTEANGEPLGTFQQRLTSRCGLVQHRPAPSRCGEFRY
jgi:hypothetical protein